MDIFNVLTMVGGLALFLYGMNLLGEGLTKLSGGKLEIILEKMTNSTIKSIALGAAVTAIIQSSSATTVMVIGFVNSGIMKLSQAVGVIMGANIGTTFTSWILSLTGINGKNIFIQLLKPSFFSPILAVIGISFIMFSKKERKRDIGTILIGFTILMFGMDTMSSAVEPLANVKGFTNILTMFSNPILGLLAGIVLTAIIQSSSASIGILQVLCKTGLGYASAVPIIMGQNIGTCVTAILSSIGAGKNAKRAAIIHLYFNLIGTVVFMTAFYIINAFVGFAFMNGEATTFGIAIFHTSFNIFATILFFPFANVLVKLATLTIKDDKKSDKAMENKQEFMLLDSRFMDNPAFAVEQCKNVSLQMALLSKKTITLSADLLANYDEMVRQEIINIENRVDKYEDELGTYMVKLAGKNMSESDSRTLSMLLYCISDFERISDHALNISETAQEMYDKKISFSEKAKSEITVYTKALQAIVELTERVFRKEDLKLAITVEPLEEVIDDLNVELKKRHVKRLRDGTCTIELGFALSDIIADYERVADHCSNIAVCMLQIHEDGFETHEYLGNFRKEENKNFMDKYMEFKKKYQLI